MPFNYVAVAVGVPSVQIANCKENGAEILKLVKKAQDKKVKVLVLPELSLTAYTCGDLFFQTPLLVACEMACKELLLATELIDMVIAIGLPVAVDNQTFNCMAVLHKGTILGLVPKTYLPNYNEFYEERWFASSLDLRSDTVTYCGQTVPIGTDLLFCEKNNPYLKIGIEVCEDLWSPIPPSSHLAQQGATILLNGSASNELVAKPEYRHNLISQQSSRTLSAYAYASAGIGESTQDTIFSGHSLIYENGALLAEILPFEKESDLKVVHIDVEMLYSERKKQTTYMQRPSDKDMKCRKIEFVFKQKESIEKFHRTIPPHPFTPKNDKDLHDRCEHILSIQSIALARRFQHIYGKSMVIGISGGLDSTLALLVAVKACQYLELPMETVLGITMPGFGTSDRTYQNAVKLMELLGISTREISIAPAVRQHFQDIGHDETIRDVTYENSQARERTQILMNIANQQQGMVVGTGDLSELALGFATYNGDHMSMYGVNAGVPKTLVRVLVNHIAGTGELGAEASRILLDVLDTPVSPELLPPDETGNIDQKTEDLVGPYELHDFFLYQILRFGFSPRKVLFLAEQAFAEKYTRAVLLKWLHNFYKRFFIHQFKRSCLPDGPKIGALCLSPRSDWRMPTDASSRVWLAEVEELMEEV
ncbi:MAG: NAD(+) synthase [Bacillota bacterium]